jgi:uncharacterized protein with HEPN domain
MRSKVESSCSRGAVNMNRFDKMQKHRLRTQMAGMRDKLIHEYFGVDLEILWGPAKDDVPQLKTSISKVTESYLQ